MSTPNPTPRKKTHNGGGSIRRKPNGTWEARLMHDGKRVSFTGKTQKEALGKMNAARRRIVEGGPMKDSSGTVGAWIRQWRETSLPASDRAESTKEEYGSICRSLEADTELSAVRLKDLRPADVEKMQLRLKDRGLLDRTRLQYHIVLKLAIDSAVDNGLLAVSPMAKVKRPKVKKVKRQEGDRYLTPEQVSQLIERMSGSRFQLPLIVAVTTGLRRGEVLALKWSGIDWDAGTASIKGTLTRTKGKVAVTDPKTPHSERVVPLPPEVLALLKGHLAAQDVERERAGDQWDRQWDGMVFRTQLGGPVEGRNFYRAVAAAEKGLGLPTGVHLLRHSAASALLDAGENLKAVSDLLGHSNANITARVYLHAAPASAGVAKLAGVFGVVGGPATP